MAARVHYYGQNHAHCLTKNIYRRARILEKINYMHNNPVRRRLVSEPGEWPWLSWRFYYREDSSVLRMDPIP